MNATAQVRQINRALPAAVNAAMQQDERQHPHGMAINVQARDSLARIAMSGRFDFQTWRSFINSYAPLLGDIDLREIWIDMTKVDYMDSSALGMLLLLNERAQANGKQLVLHVASNFVWRAFEYARFSKIFNIKCSTSEMQ